MATSESQQAPILVVEDDQQTREVMKLLLEFEGYAVETAADGAEALRKLHTGLKPCLIVLDLMMPGMDGFQFMREKREDPSISAIPVVIGSGHYDAKINADRLGAEAYFQKPVEPDKLLNLVGTHRRRSRLRIAS